MTFPDPRLNRPGSLPVPPDSNTQDVIPLTERSEDPVRSTIEHGLAIEGSRPLTDEERKAADRDAPPGERVYAPASERVPVEPVPGHREFVEHPDTHTSEREAAGSTTPGTSPGASSQSSFRPIQSNATDTPTPGAYASPMSNPGGRQSNAAQPDDGSSGSRRRNLLLGIGFTWFAVVCGVGVWLFMRWQRERNKPINRIRRQARQAAVQARQAAGTLRERVPVPDAAARPAMGLSTAVLSMLVLVWQQSRARDTASRAGRRGEKDARQPDGFAERATQAVADADWMKRLTKLKERWNPSRLELEKGSISDHP